MLANRLRVAIEAAEGPVPVTASAGVAAHGPVYGKDAEALLAAADAAQYRAKSAGRNRVEADRRPRSADEGYTVRMRRILGRAGPWCVLSVALAACSSDGDAAKTPSGPGGDAGSDGGTANTGGAGGAGTSNGGAAGGTAGAAPSTGGGGTSPGNGGTSPGGGASATGGGASTGGTTSKRPYPDTTSKIAILTDQLPNLSDPQRAFVVSHFVGTEKQTLSQSKALRALAPDFLVLHYHLSMWQSAPTTDFIVDGVSWGNDYPTVTTHESWFLHDLQSQRLASTADQKLLMNVSNAEFQKYWADSLATQVQAGEYDGIFFDSASPALLQAEVGGQDSRLAGTGAKDATLAELGNVSFIHAWETWMGALDATLGAKGIPLIPNTSAFVTGWDDTNYELTAGAFVEGFADPSFAESDWKASTSRLLSMAKKHKILILQNYLGSPGDVGKRLFYLANYLLVKGDRTYLEYFAAGPLEWYPEWGLDLGAPVTTGATAADLLVGGVYRRDFERGSVLVNPSDAAVDVTLPETRKLVTPQGGGAIDDAGAVIGSMTTADVTTVTVPGHGAQIVIR